MLLKITKLYIAAVFVAWASPPVYAQYQGGFSETVKTETVRNRTREEYDPVGLRLGSSYLYPYLNSGVLYDDNIFAANTGEESDAVWKSNGGALLKSDWGRHLFDAEVGFINYTHFEESSDDRTDVFGKADARIDVTRSFNIATKVKGGSFTEGRGASNAPSNAVELTPYTLFDARVSLNTAFNRVSLHVGGAFREIDYDDVGLVGGGTIDQDARDGNTYTAIARTAYEFSPGYRAFAEVEGNWREYGGKEGSQIKDSEGIEGRAGVQFEVTRVMAGEISAGYLYQDYDDETLSDIDSFAFRGELLWNPTRLMTIELVAGREVVETTFGAASGSLETMFKARVDYEILRNVVGTAEFEFVEEDFQGIDRTDEIFTTGVSLEYLINRNLSASAFYSIVTKDSSVSEIGYDRNQVGGSVKLKF